MDGIASSSSPPFASAGFSLFALLAALRPDPQHGGGSGRVDEGANALRDRHRMDLRLDDVLPSRGSDLPWAQGPGSASRLLPGAPFMKLPGQSNAARASAAGAAIARTLTAAD